MGSEVRLRDGSRATIRPIEPGDKRLIAAAFAELSPESRYRRFFTPLARLDDGLLAYLTEVDHHDHEALVAIAADSGSAVGVARFVRVAQDVAEPAVVVVDRWQRRGLAGALLERLVDRARAEGVARFSGVVLAQNREALGLLEGLGAVPGTRSGPELRFDVALPQPAGSGGALLELLRAFAAGILAPVGAVAEGRWSGDG
jgi:GNAT superfamily N-acetyltransferase